MGTQVIKYGSLTAANDATPTHTPGTVYQDITAGVTYQYVRFDNGSGNITAVAGHCVYTFTQASYVVTNDVSDSVTAGANSVCGVIQLVVTDQYYTWMIVKGPYATVKTNGDDDISQNDCIFGVGDGTVNSDAAGTAPKYKVLGWATAADVDANDTVAATITVGPM